MLRIVQKEDIEEILVEMDVLPFTERNLDQPLLRRDQVESSPKQKRAQGLTVPAAQPAPRLKINGIVRRLPNSHTLILNRNTVVSRWSFVVRQRKVVTIADKRGLAGGSFPNGQRPTTNDERRTTNDKLWSPFMPIFEYICKDCLHEFEALVFGKDKAECPKCHSKKLEPQLSVFAAGKSTSSDAMTGGACAGCGDPRGPGACSWKN